MKLDVASWDNLSHLGEIKRKKWKFIEGKSKRIRKIFEKTLSLSFLSRNGKFPTVYLRSFLLGKALEQLSNV